VCLAAHTRERLVAKDERGRWVELERRDEEPLALADVGRVAATERILRPYTANRCPDKRRLQRSLRGRDARNAPCVLRDGRDEPVPSTIEDAAVLDTLRPILRS